MIGHVFNEDFEKQVDYVVIMKIKIENQYLFNITISVCFFFYLIKFQERISLINFLSFFFNFVKIIWNIAL